LLYGLQTDPELRYLTAVTLKSTVIGNWGSALPPSLRRKSKNRSEMCVRNCHVAWPHEDSVMQYRIVDGMEGLVL
jgi:hypothetical protein